ncbi:MAG: amidohydrolase family protein [Longimicrobiales bacterium]
MRDERRPRGAGSAFSHGRQYASHLDPRAGIRSAPDRGQCGRQSSWNHYAGIAPDDERMAPYWALAEELDIPVGIHVGPGPPGAIYLGSGGYRARLHSALTIEEVLVRHPRLRVYLMHAGYPMLDDLLAVLYAHPHVYVDVGVIVFTQPRPAFYRYLRGIVDAGFGDRVMFESDHIVWPGALDRAIAVIEEAPFLSEEQKRDILYNNAARFLRLSEEEIARDRRRLKRGGGLRRTTAGPDDVAAKLSDHDLDMLIPLDDALTRLQHENERLARVVECRFFAGLSIPDTAHVLGISRATVKRDWKVARAWLYCTIRRRNCGVTMPRGRRGRHARHRVTASTCPPRPRRRRRSSRA